jgi:thermitase
MRLPEEAWAGFKVSRGGADSIIEGEYASPQDLGSSKDREGSVSGKGKIAGLSILALSFFIIMQSCPAPLPAGPPAAAAASAGNTASSFIFSLREEASGFLGSAEEALRQMLPPGVEWKGAERLFDRVFRLRLPVSLPEERVLGLLSASGAVEYAEVDQLRRALETPNDPYYGQQWHFGPIRAEEGWDVTRGSGSVTVAVIDTGVDYNHPDLASRVTAGYDYANGDSDPYDDNGHGTHVAGLAAAATDNGIGVAGVDWNARILPLKVLDSSGSGYDSDIASAIRYAADSGAQVINMSLGSSTSSYTLQSAVNYAYGKGVTIVAAAGNDGSGSVSYPAAYNGVIAVGAIDSSNNKADFSNYGSKLDLVAPGVGVYSTYAGSRYQSMSGTSMASPIVAGAACLVLAAFPSLSGKPDDVASKLTSTASDLGAAGFDNYYGYGKVDLAAALRGSEPEPPQPPEPPPPAGDVLDSISGGCTSWYLAEGYTGPGFSTYLLLENPNTSGAQVTVEAATSRGEYHTLDLELPAQSRTTLRLNSYWPDREVSTHIEVGNGVGILVERSMYFSNGSYEGGHCAAAAAAPSTSWYFAEGYTGPSFDEWILVLNPQPFSQQALLRMLTGSGDILEFYYTLPAVSRFTIHVNDLVPGEESSAHLITDYPVVAERAMYFDYKGVSDGHASMGCSQLSSAWYFAEGYTGPGFDEWLLILNPYYYYSVDARIDFFFADGTSTSRSFELPPASRNTFKINDIVGSREVSMRVTTSSDFPVMAERAMYFLYRDAWGGGHSALGATATSSTWGLAEGYCGPGFDTWVLVENLGDEASATAFYLLYPDGTHDFFSRSIAPRSRFSLPADEVARQNGFSVVVDSANRQPLVVEQSVYFGGSCEGGSCEVGTALSRD